MRKSYPAILIMMTLLTSLAWGQGVKRTPHIGYLYPAGGQRGTTFKILVGGQFLRGMKQVRICGQGIKATVVEHYRPFQNLDKEQRDELKRKMLQYSEKCWAELVDQGKAKGNPPWRKGKKKPEAPKDKKAKPVQLPRHPLLNDWENKSLRELAAIRNLLLDRRKQQRNAQIAESVLIEITIDPAAATGDRELRLYGKQGMTGPMVFQVGQLPEVREIESNDPISWDPLPKNEPYDLPLVINGQVFPGDVDRFKFHATAGQQLVFETHARHLIPFLADAVPGWFQATLGLYDAKGKELAFVDDYQFNPDPVLFYKVPADGIYQLEIRDSIYRGRKDFVYRISIGEFPFITHLFPLGGPAGSDTIATVGGWNLPTQQVVLHGDVNGLGRTFLSHDLRDSNRVLYATDTLSEYTEREPNDRYAQGQPVVLPVVMNGRIRRAGDIDVYRIEGLAGDEVVAEVIARRLRSPLDSLLRIVDASGKVVALNDDSVDKKGFLHRDMGILTHHADSYVRATLPKDGTYGIQVSDTTGHGGEAYAYRLRISMLRPDFELLVGPSSVTVPTGRCVPMTVYVRRKDGFKGAVTLKIAGEDHGLQLDGGVIPAGHDQIQLTLGAPNRRPKELISLQIQGHATIDGKTVTHQAKPIDNVMQAFLWRHLMPAQELLVLVNGGARSAPLAKIIGEQPVRIPMGKTAKVRVKVAIPAHFKKLRLKLKNKVKGVALHQVAFDKAGVSFQLKTDSEDAKVGLANNLVFEVSAEVSWKDKKGKTQTRRRELGVLPAISFLIEEK